MQIFPKTLKGRLTALVAASSLLVSAVALELVYRETTRATGLQQLSLLGASASAGDPGFLAGLRSAGA